MRARWVGPLVALGLAAAFAASLSIIEVHDMPGQARAPDPDAGEGRVPRVTRSAVSVPISAQRTVVDRPFVIGRSLRGRPIRAEEMGNPASQRSLMLVGCVHGNECAGIAIARALAAEPPPPSADVWIVFDLNPDGHHMGTRQNARGVDLNRNFPYRWRPVGSRGSTFYSGAGPRSEPETRAAVRLIDALRPATSIWFHQHLDTVDLSGGNPAIERRYASLVGLRTTRLPRYPGSATTWQDHAFPGTTGFVVELPQTLSHQSAERYADAALALIGS
jgi:murein peptide amidase A